jgi:carbonic anhydrase
VCETTVVQDAWERGQPLSVHAWIYSLRDGLITDLHLDVDAAAEMRVAHARAVARLAER